jgi:hypothetical protein
LEPIIGYSYDRKFTPQMFMMWNETQTVYAFDYSVSKVDSVKWVLDGSFKNSTVQFAAPRIMPWQLYRLAMYQDKFMA